MAHALVVDVDDAESWRGALEKIEEHYETLAPSALGTWSDAHTIAVAATGGVGRLERHGRALLEHLRERFGVIVDVDENEDRVVINHEIRDVVIEVARILHLQMEQTRMMEQRAATTSAERTPAPAAQSPFSPVDGVSEDAMMREVLGKFGNEEIGNVCERLEGRRATRMRLVELLGTPLEEQLAYPIEHVAGSVVRVRLPRRSFSDDKRYGVGVIMRAAATTSSSGDLTWCFQVNMGGGRLHETDIVYISNDAITVPEVCRLLHRCSSDHDSETQGFMSEVLSSKPAAGGSGYMAYYRTFHALYITCGCSLDCAA
ncbi:hypothetical protein BE221DRAFT_147703 [Ostreococcus tauri]|uniref:Uncharacterized protein n=1 Tax=Ostreococcus tauri TaxID=70448 RepID=A0A1Y5I1E3_OSTTA|nr:hypothetical protein BE221DRAFT_147703 [Ostreococcus tauri]